MHSVLPGFAAFLTPELTELPLDPARDGWFFSVDAVSGDRVGQYNATHAASDAGHSNLHTGGVKTGSSRLQMCLRR